MLEDNETEMPSHFTLSLEMLADKLCYIHKRYWYWHTGAYESVI